MMPNETTNTPILTLDSDAKLETAQSISDLTWHEIQNAYRTRRILTGMPVSYTHLTLPTSHVV